MDPNHSPARGRARALGWGCSGKELSLIAFALHQDDQPSAQSPNLQNQSPRPSKGPRLEQRVPPALRHLGALHGEPTYKAWSPAAADGCLVGPSHLRKLFWGQEHLAVESLLVRSGTTPSLRKTPDPQHLSP